MKKKTRKYNRLKNAIAGAKRSYTMKLNKGDMMVKYMTEKEYIDYYMMKKEYKEYVKYRKSVSKGIQKKEMSYETFIEAYEQLPDINEPQFGFGKKIAKEELIISESKMKAIKKERSYFNINRNMDGYALHDLIANLIDEGLIESKQVDSIIY